VVYIRMNNFFKMSSSLKAYAPIFKLQGKPVREEPVREEPVCEEPVREEPVREEPVREEPVREETVRAETVHAEEIAVDVSTPKNSCLDLNCSSCGNAFPVQCPRMDMDMDPNTHPWVIFFKNVIKDYVICNQCSCYLAVDLDNDEYNKEQQAVLRTADEAEGHDEFVIALGGQVTESDVGDSDVEDSDVEDGCQSSASNQGVPQQAVSYPPAVSQPSVSSADEFSGNQTVSSLSVVPARSARTKCSNMIRFGFCYHGWKCYYAKSTPDHTACRSKGEPRHKSHKCKFCAMDQPQIMD
jgi:hypothetical protein